MSKDRANIDFLHYDNELKGLDGGIRVWGVTYEGVVQRVTPHGHIQGLGVDKAGRASPMGGGMVGQTEAREAAALVVDMIKSRRLGGRCVLLGGPTGTGKSALGVAISRELGSETPYVALTGSEVFSAEVKKTEVLIEHVRRAISVRLSEVKTVYEGEVTEITIEESENPHGGTGKYVTGINLGLKSSEGHLIIGLPAFMNESLQRYKIRIGDVVFIDQRTVMLRRVGRCDAYASESDLESDDYVPLPRGPVTQQKEVVQDVTLHELDVANARPESSTDLVSVFSSFMKNSKTEITEKLRAEVNMAVNTYLEAGIAQINPGILFIDEVHMLDIEAFTFLNKTLESEHSPIIVMASNRGVTTIRGTDDIGPHGLPTDLLDRLLIIRTINYTLPEILSIIELRAAYQGLHLDASAIKVLGNAAYTGSLRFAEQLLEPARVLAELAGAKEITAAHVESAQTCFIDARVSASNMAEPVEPAPA